MLSRQSSAHACCACATLSRRRRRRIPRWARRSRRFLQERKLIPAAVQVALLAREMDGPLTLLADFPCSESQLRELERTAGHVSCALCAGPTPIAEAVARPMRPDGRVRDVGVGEGALGAALAALAAFGVVRERDTVPEIVPAVLRTGLAAVPSPSSRTTRSAARLSARRRHSTTSTCHLRRRRRGSRPARLRSTA